VKEKGVRLLFSRIGIKDGEEISARYEVRAWVLDERVRRGLCGRTKLSDSIILWEQLSPPASPCSHGGRGGGQVAAIGLQAGRSYLGNDLLIIGNGNLTLYKTAKRKGVPFFRSTLSYSEHLGATGWAYALRCWFAILHSYTLGVLHFSFGSAFHTIGLHVFTPFCFCKVVLSHIVHLRSQSCLSRYYKFQLNQLRFRQTASRLFRLLGFCFSNLVFVL